MRGIIRYCGVLFVAVTLHASALAGPIVATKSGAIEGVDRGGVLAFLGVPFAAPPVRNLRWRPPAPVAPWTGARPAKRFGPDCIQEPMSSPPGPGFINSTSENCLYLNVWRPRASGDRRPVMVWIHGGAFIMGAGSFPSYDGGAFASRGVILVTLNYRLGRFGTFAHPALRREQGDHPVADFGLLDQIAALAWVRDNIASFGGDASNVTIFGESAGASSVNFLMASPLAEGLFAKAIAQSGGSSSDLKTFAAAEAEGAAWAKTAGVAEDIKALRALPADRVWDGPVTVVASPVIDGTVVTQSTDDAFHAGAFARIPYLVGANSQEESLLRWLPGLDEAFLKTLGERGDAALSLYETEGLDRKSAVAKLWGEAAMVEPARFRARQTARRGVATWLYRYGYVPDAAPETTTGAGHDAEIEVVFANPDQRWPKPWSTRDAAIAETIQGYWINFARTGNPNGPGLPTWPAYTLANDTLMAFSKVGPVATEGFGKSRLDLLEAAYADRKSWTPAP
ncbi:carboxylesterase/lipase family protein [Caulobacter sp. Root655]|uniref:carboxylesterase/lipase family protein n=1 Tax=Caulobacter sp. Root655 TaxID=1736578 RepID=UPI0012E3CF28|nr:carboxylesterase family protein [Caulobacter sp. Root655]